MMETARSSARTVLSSIEVDVVLDPVDTDLAVVEMVIEGQAYSFAWRDAEVLANLLLKGCSDAAFDVVRKKLANS